MHKPTEWSASRFAHTTRHPVARAKDQGRMGLSPIKQDQVVHRGATTLVAPALHLTYTTPVMILTRTITLSANSPILTGGVAVLYAISPALPTGLTFDTVTGNIADTPTVPSDTVIYTITATTTTGATVATTISLIVYNDVTPNLFYNPGFWGNANNDIRLPVGFPCLFLPTVTGLVNSFSYTDAPSALTYFNTTTGEFQLSPSIIQNGVFTITAKNFIGSTSLLIVYDFYDPNT